MSRLIYHPIVVLIITVFAVVLLVSLNKSAQKTKISTQHITSLEAEVHEMSKNVIDIEEKIAKTNSDSFKEKIVRNELLLQKSNEKVIQIPDFEILESENLEESIEKTPFSEWRKLIKL